MLERATAGAEHTEDIAGRVGGPGGLRGEEDTQVSGWASGWVMALARDRCSGDDGKVEQSHLR